MLVVLAVCIVVVLFLYNHFTKYNNYWKYRNVPGPDPTFFFGNITGSALRIKPMREIYKDICDKYPNEKIIGIFHMRSPVLLVKDCEIIKHILVKDFENFADRDIDFAEQGLEVNVFDLNGEKWRAMRRNSSPFFSPKKLKDMMYVILERGDKLVNYVEELVREQSNQDIYAITNKFTQSCITACGFGLDFDILNNSTDILNKLEPKIFIRNFKAELEMMYPGILRRLKFQIGYKEVLDYFTDLTKDLISKRNGDPSGSNDFMDFMLGHRKAQRNLPTNTKPIEITDDFLLGQLFVFYAAGYHTSSLAMSFMLHSLATNPDIQDKVYVEIEQVLQKYDGKLCYEAVWELKFMGQVFDETLRLYPPTENLRRRAKADYKVPGTDLTVNKGQIIFIPIPEVHMDPRNYPDPEVFDPNRFSQENKASRHSCAFLPFGLGPRQCLGLRLGELLSKVGMAKLLYSFRMEPVDNVLSQKFEYKASFHLQPKSGFPIKFIPRR